MTLRAAEQHYRTEAALAAAVTRQVARYWRQVPVGDINAWQRAEPAVGRLVAAAQFRAASGADEYVQAALAEQGVRVRPEARVVPQGFAAMANGDLPVLDLLDQPRIQALTAIGAGAAPAAALQQAGKRLETYVASLVQDAGRQADSAATFARPRVGWVRMVNAPCCKDCAILAGKWYRSNEGFPRHPFAIAGTCRQPRMHRGTSGPILPRCSALVASRGCVRQKPRRSPMGPTLRKWSTLAAVRAEAR